MIRSMADVLRAFMDEESAQLATFNVSHGPTIGDMYEGLSAEVLNRAIPSNLDLQVVNGFTVDTAGLQSGQMDCMLVRGSGEQIPFTNSYRWPIRDVLAVFEVKKTLGYDDLKDSFVHLRAVYESSIEAFHAQDPHTPIDIRRSLNAFGQITGVHSNGKTDDLPNHLQMMHYTLIMEQLTPVRIVWGYGGYKTQTGLRNAIIRFLEKALKDEGIARGFGVGSFPQLISCNGISILKANGQPYRSQMRGDSLWPFLFSSKTNPVWLMLELLWAKIEHTFDISMPFGDGVEQEALIELLAAKSVEKDGTMGWGYEIRDYSGVDDDPKETVDFSPLEISIDQSVVLRRLATGRIDTTDEQLLEFLRRNGHQLASFVSELRATGLASFDGRYLYPTTENVHIVMCPDGRVLAGSNTDQMLAYVGQKEAKRQREPDQN